MKKMLQSPDKEIDIKVIPTTLNEYLNSGDKKYSDEEIEVMLSKLGEDDRRIASLYYKDKSQYSRQFKFSYAF